MQKIKKDNGSTFNSIIPNLLCVIVVCVFTLLFISWIASIENKQNINQICRKYILQMESTGYLTAEQQSNLIKDLKDAGMINVNTHWNESDGTTGTQVEYGEEIFLKVTGQLEIVDYSQNAWECKDKSHEPTYISGQTCPYCGTKSPKSSFGNNFIGLISGTTTWDINIQKSSISKQSLGEKIEADQCFIYIDANAGGTIKGNVSNKTGSVGAYTTISKGSNRVITKDQILNIQIIPSPGYTIKSINLDGKEEVVTNPTQIHSENIPYKENGRSLIVTFEPNKITYKVKHHQMKIGGTGYELVLTQELTGYTGDLVTPETMQYTGFKSLSPITKTLTVNSSGICEVEFNYYYERMKYQFINLSDTNVDTNGTTANGSYYYDQTINLKAVISGEPKEAFVLTNWEDINTKEHYDLITSFKMPAHDVTIKPQITIKTYNIVFDANTGSGSIDSINNVKFFDNIQLPNGDNFTKKGYKLIGWSITPDAITPTYSLGQYVSGLTYDEEVRLYAVWESLGATKYVVEYYTENENGTYDKHSNLKVVTEDVYSSTFVVIDNEFVKTNITDSGIYTYSHATDNNDNIITSFYPNADGSTVIKLYYSRYSYKVTIQMDDHSAYKGLKEYTAVYKHGQTVELNGITFDKHYQFKNFKENSNTNTTINIISNGISFKMPDSDISISIYSTPIEYNIDYELNGGELFDKKIKYNIEDGTFTINNPVKSHYTFLGWTGMDISEPQLTLTIISGEWAEYGDLYLIANWIIDKFNIKVANPGSGGSIYINGQIIDFKNEAEANFVFEYGSNIQFTIIPIEYGSIEKIYLYKSSTDTTSDEILNIKEVLLNSPTSNTFTTSYITVNRNMKLETSFVNEKYTIKFHSNNGKNETKTQEVSFNDEVALLENTFTKTGYTFKGWARQEINTEDSESYVEFVDKQKIKNLIEESNGIIDLYAVWQDETAPTATITITNDFASRQIVTIKAADTGSGVKSIIMSNVDVIDDIIQGEMYNTNEMTYEITSNGTYYFYVQDNKGNISRIYANGQTKPEIVFYQTTLEDNMNSYTEDIKYVITADLPNYTFTFPTVSLQDYEYVGWSKTPTSTTGIKSLDPSENTSYYPVFKPVNAYLVTGIAFNSNIKNLIYLENASNKTDKFLYETIDTYITDIVLTTTPPATNKAYVKLNASGSDVLGYLDGTTLKIYTTANKIYTNKDSSYMFYNFRNVKSNNLITASNFSTERTYNMQWMFAHYGYETTTLNLSKFNTSNVVNMEKMFAYCGYNKLTSINFGSNFNTNLVTDMSEMFLAFGYNNLSKLIINFNTQNLEDVESMFAYCGYKNMSQLNITLNTQKINTFNYMFAYTGCDNMTQLTLSSNFTNNENTSANSMFLYCGNEKLTNIDLSMLNIINFNNKENMFENFGKKNECTIKLNSLDSVNDIINYNFNNINHDLLTN